MPDSVLPLTGLPEKLTRLTVIQLFPEMTKPFAWPLTVTSAAGAAWNEMGAADVPEVRTVTDSGYVPAATCTVWPAPTARAAALIVQNGWVSEPDPLSEQLELP